MKTTNFRIFAARLAAGLSVLACARFAFAAPVTPDQACAVAAAWAAENAALARDLGEALAPVAEEDADGTLLWYEVPTSGGGCLVVAPDTQLEPVIAVVPDYAGGIPDGHPLRALLETDLRQRLAVLRGTAPVRPRAASAAAASAEVAADASRAAKKWARLAGGAALAPAGGRRAAAKGTAAATPARVYSFLDEWKRAKLTHWNQNGWNSFGSWGELYDLYTPDHDPCGCVATAGAALLQFFGVTQAPSLSNTCFVDGVATTLTTKGGSYDWSILPGIWSTGQTLTDEQKDLLGRATYDMGVCLGMAYAADGSAASIASLAAVLREQYGFADARYVHSISASHYEKLIYAQVRSGCPVVLSIWNSSSGHAVLAVGYGEDADSAAYTRVFMGWGGSNDAWYALPNVDDYTSVDGVVTMIGTTSATIPVCGRVVDENGDGDGFTTVSCYSEESGHSYVRSLMANEHGAWGTRVSPTLAASAQKVACKDVTQSYSIGAAAATVKTYNSAGTLCAALPDVLELPLPSAKILPVLTTIAAARERAVFEGKPVFLLAGTQWCGYCTQLKRYLNSLGADFTDRFVLCYLDMDEEQPSDMRLGGFPTYGIFDPRRLGEDGWTAANGLLLLSDYGWIQSAVDAFLADGWAAWSAVDRSPTELVVTLPSVIVSATPCTASIVFADGLTCPLADGVSWSLVSGTAATLADGVLTPVEGETGTVTVGAEVPLAGQTLVRTADIRVVAPSDVTGLVVTGPDVIDLYDVAGAQFTALATLADGSTAGIAVDWSVSESAVTNAVVSANGYVGFPDPSEYTQASRLTVSANYGAHTATASADVWGWSAAISAWTMPQRTLWPGETIQVVPQSVTWWRHGVTEEPTNDFSGISFSCDAYIHDTEWHYLRRSETDSPDEVVLAIPSDFACGDGYGYMSVSTWATRHDRTVKTWETEYFAYLAAAPAQTVAVTFDANGGEPATQTSTYAVGFPYRYLPHPYRKGYYASGWYTAETGGTRVTADSNCLASVTHLFAHWSPEYYSIYYNANGGNGAMSSSYFYYDIPATLRSNTFTKANAVFAGWATEPDGEVVFADGEEILNLYDTYHSLTLYAVWVENGYTVVFDANGGAGAMRPQACPIGTCTALTPAAFSRRGATFAGWARTPDGPVAFADGAAICDLATTAGDTVILYAVWDLPAVASLEIAGPDAIDLYDADSAQFTATCRLADGTVVDVAPRWSVEETAVTNAVISDEGLVSFSRPENYTVASRLTVSAECNGVRASRSSDVWGWSAAISAWTMPQRTLWPGETIQVVPQSVIWWRHGVTEEPTNDFSGISFSCYAYIRDTEWHYLSGGETDSPDEVVLAIPADFACGDGYGYMGVSTRAARHNRTVKTGGTEYFAYLAAAPAQTVTVVFDANGGEPATETSTYAVGSPYRYLPYPYRKGYYAARWYTAETGGTRVTADSNCLASVTHLFAHWSPKYYYIYYNANGGYGAMSFNQFYYDTPATLRPNVFMRRGYAFDGWSTEPDGEVVFADGEEILNLFDSYHELTLYAHWTQDTVSVSLPEALDSPLSFTTGGDDSWFGQHSFTSDGIDAAQSGAIADTQSSWLQAAVSGPGTIRFSWKVSSESASYDYLEFLVDGTQVAKIGGTNMTSWAQVAFAVTGSGPHTLRWNYCKDSSYSDGFDCGWVDQVTWSEDREDGLPGSVDVDGDRLPTSWLETAGRLDGVTTAEELATRWRSLAANGLPLRDCYVAGLDPADPAAVFKVTSLAVADGEMQIKWAPDLAPERTYVEEGKASMADEWGPRDASSRFFRVRVGLPE